MPLPLDNAAFRLLFDHNLDAILVTRPDGSVLRANRAAARLLWRTEEELSRLHRGDLVVDTPRLRAMLAERAAEGKTSGEVTMRRPGGTTFDAEVVSARFDVAGAELSYVFFRDMTNARLVAAREHEAERRYAAVFRDAPFPIVLSSATDGRIVATNAAFLKQFETREDAVTGKTSTEAGFLHPADRARLIDAFSQSGAIKDVLCRGYAAGGRTRWYSVTASPVTIDDQGFVVTVLHDVHEQTITEATLAAREHDASERARELATILECVQDGVVVYAPDGRIVQTNAAARRFLHLDPNAGDVPINQRIDAGAWRTEAGRPLSVNELPVVRVLASGKAVHDEIVGTGEGDLEQWFLVNAAPIVGSRGLAGAVVSFSDVTTRKKAEDALARQSDLLQAVIAGTPSIIWAFDEDGRVTLANPSTLAFFGVAESELIGQRVADVIPAVSREFTARQALVMASGQPATAELRLTLADGERTVLATRYPLRDRDGRIYGTAGIGTDITKQKQVEADLRASEARARDAQAALEQALETTRLTEEELRQSQKMEAIGLLAGGVAHDFNNLLTVVLGYSDALLGDLSTDDPRYEAISEIHSAGCRASALTRQLLAFSRKQILAPRVVDLNQQITASDSLLRRIIGEDIEFVLRQEPQVRLCKLDPGQFEQVLLNLAVNARDAMPDGGRLTVATSNVYLSAEDLAGFPDASAGPHVRVTVSDTGVGMTAEVKQRLFEPFFTTKPPGRGTGLGLATVYGIVRQSGGTIRVTSERGEGTTFSVYVPCVAADRPEPSPPLAAAAPKASGATVLLAEDDDHVRASIGALLRRGGYDVLEASSGSEAIQLAETYGARIHVLLTDVVMPKMNGRKLADALKATRPDIRVVFMSGYTEDAIVHHGVLDPGLDFLPKPITTEALLTMLRQVLER